MRHGQLLARTHEAEVFAWDEGRVLKLYRPGVAPETVEREAANARAAHAAGVRTPGIVEVCTVDGRRGTVFERVEGPTMLEALVAEPASATQLGHVLADLQADLHCRPAPGFPALHARLAERVERATGLEPAERHAALAALEALPAGNALCHGDLHPSNVLLAADGAVIIDWRDATRGDPAADIARSSLLMRHAEIPGGLPAHAVEALARLRETVHTAWLSRYAARIPGGAVRLDAWLLPVAAARLAEPVGTREREAIRQLIAGLVASKERSDVP